MTEPVRTLRVYLRDIAESLSRIKQYTKDMTIDQFDEDLKTKDAVIRCLTVIGEAVKNVPDDFRNEHPEIQWRKIAGMRDVIVHEYFGVDTEKVWTAVEGDIPLLERKIQELLEKTP